MPINEILAPSYVIVTYKTGTLPNHTFRMYFDAVPTADEAGNYRFSTYTDSTYPLGWSVRNIVKEVLERVGLDTARIPSYTVGEVAVWRTLSGVNEFLGLDSGDYSTSWGGGATPNAAATYIMVLKAADRSQYRLQLADTGDTKPQRTPGLTPPVSDNGSLAWFVARSAVKFVTQDNKPIVTLASINTGYNRKLAREYGRLIAP